MAGRSARSLVLLDSAMANRVEARRFRAKLLLRFGSVAVMVLVGLPCSSTPLLGSARCRYWR